ncbi:MAG: restriction endonuclease [Gemmatimonadetes bacterium]|nr:restriction endonuclease [Gemmatimonadota bacterium]
MAKRISFELKEKMVSLAGACFWYWSSFYSFLDSSGVPKTLQQKYPREAYNKYQVMRNLLSDLEQANQLETIKSIISNFFKLRTAIDRDNLDESKAKELLREFRELVGNDPIESEIRKMEHEKVKVAYQQSVDERRSQTKHLEELNTKFTTLITLNELTAQQRGYRLEELFFDLLQFSEFEYSKPYRTTDGEQIDGHFKYEKFDYLVEAKWTEEITKQKDLSVFDGKIRGKAQSTRGLFLSANGFDENAVSKFSGDAPRIILMTGDDLAIVLRGQVSFFDAMKAKVDAIVRYGNINFAIRSITT